jgi:hypothetical protein
MNDVREEELLGSTTVSTRPARASKAKSNDRMFGCLRMFQCPRKFNQKPKYISPGPKFGMTPSQRGKGKSREGAGAADISSDTAKDRTENADAFVASKQPRVGDLKQLQDRCSQLEARLLAKRRQWEGGNNSAPSSHPAPAKATPAKATPSPSATTAPAASAPGDVPPSDLVHKTPASRCLKESLGRLRQLLPERVELVGKM